jgi:hypothetical protein
MTQAEKKSIELFYTPPKDEYFEELKSLCIRFWLAFPEFSMWDEKQEQLEREYAQSKIDLINSLKNEGSNFVTMVQMIHQNSRQVLSKCLSLETRNEISMRLYGFDDNEFDPFNIWNIQNNIHDT